jgi:hypothetical protein
MARAIIDDGHDLERCSRTAHRRRFRERLRLVTVAIIMDGLEKPVTY